MMFDVNGHYVFNSLDRLEFYGLQDLILCLHSKKKNGQGQLHRLTRKAIMHSGLNLGAGTYMKITEQFDIYGEAKYLLSKYDQFMLNVGVLVNLDWLIKHENTGM